MLEQKSVQRGTASENITKDVLKLMRKAPTQAVECSGKITCSDVKETWIQTLALPHLSYMTFLVLRFLNCKIVRMILTSSS